MNFFLEILKQWYKKNKRLLPWRTDIDPYKIWISEIMLQQTRVNQAINYYDRFLQKFPAIESLAEVEEQDVLKMWEGLGYYSRARNLYHAAKIIVNNYQGKFPDNYDEIMQLKGIGIYTAAAILSIAFKRPYAVVDGNVNRVIARYFGVGEAIDSTNGKKIIQALATQLLDENDPGEHNQAMIDFGALQCKPIPDCINCPLSESCIAYRQDKVTILPFKKKRSRIRTRYFYYLFYQDDKRFYIKKRIENDIWKNLFELPLIETPNKTSIEKLVECDKWKSFFNNQNIHIQSEVTTKHVLTHQVLYISFLHIRSYRQLFEKEQYIKISFKESTHYPFPVVIRNFLYDILKKM